MQTLRNFFFYASPLLGAALGGAIGLSYNAFVWLLEIFIGLLLGCLVSLFMIVLSVRARFKTDVSLTRNALERRGSAGVAGMDREKQSGADPDAERVVR